ncbi:MAG: regulatory protein RecX [Bacteroidales bacterium]
MHTEYDILLEKARKYCLRGEKSVYDVQQKLYQWHVPEKWHDKILNSLKKDKFIDEKRFVNSFVRDKCYLNKWGRIKIRYHLRQKQIPEHLIEEALGEIEEDKYMEILREVAKQKIKSLEGKSDDAYNRKQKLFRFLAQRGFETHLLEDTDFLSNGRSPYE